MIIKFINANILNEDFDILNNKILIVKNNLIDYIGDDKKFNYDFDRIIDCKNNYLIPTFINAHSHNAMVFARNIADDMPLLDWLNNQIFPLERKLTEEDVYYFTILGIMEGLASGISLSFDMYKFYYTMADAYLRTGARVNILESLTKYDEKIAPKEYHKNLNNYKNDNGNLIRYSLGLHAEYTNDDWTFKLIKEISKEYKAPCFMHNSETKKEFDECIDRNNMTPTEVFEKYDLFEYGGGGFHCVYITDNDIEIFKKHKLSIITNSGSNVKLASGIARIKTFLNNNINVCLGTDGAASNNAIDFFREMYLTSVLSKIEQNDPASIPAKQIVKMATINGAKCMGYDNIGVLKEGFLADICMIDVNKSNMYPHSDFLKAIVYSANKTNVKMTMVDGKILYEDGKYFINEDEEYIYIKCDELLKNLISR